MSKHNGFRGVGVHPPGGETMGLAAHSAGLRMVSMWWDCGHGNVCDRQGRAGAGRVFPQGIHYRKRSQIIYKKMTGSL